MALDSTHTVSYNLVNKGDVMAELNIEKLGVEAMYTVSTKALKLVADRDAMVVKDFDYEGARVAPAITLACTCSFVDYESGLPTKVFVSVLNELASKGFIKSFFWEPSRIPAVLNGEVNLKKVDPPNGYVLFSMVHILPEDLLQVKSKYPFLLNEGESFPTWTVEQSRSGSKKSAGAEERSGR